MHAMFNTKKIKGIYYSWNQFQYQLRNMLHLLVLAESEITTYETITYYFKKNSHQQVYSLTTRYTKIRKAKYIKNIYIKIS